MTQASNVFPDVSCHVCHVLVGRGDSIPRKTYPMYQGESTNLAIATGR